jgi:hypothetical protein
MWGMWHTLEGTVMCARFLWENLNERDLLEDLRRRHKGNMVILKWILGWAGVKYIQLP